jgi:hypothetical protein
MRCQAERRRTLSYFETLRWFRLSQNDKRDDFPQFLFSNQVGGAPAVSSRPVRDSLTRPRLRPLTSASREAGQGVITRRVPWCQGEQGGCPGSSGRERWDRGWQTCKRKIYGIGRGGVGEGVRVCDPGSTCFQPVGTPLPQLSQLPIISLVPTQLTMKVSGKLRASCVRALKPVQCPARMIPGFSSFKPWMVSLMRLSPPTVR